MRLTPGGAAPELSLLNVQGQSVALSTLWQGRLTLLSFLRHFG